ncbi:MAG: hypothetical protein ACR2K0_09120 [Acidimicrobiales bacterium]
MGTLQPVSVAVVHDTDGPRVRWGLVWFVATIAAAAAARSLLAVVMAVAAALAADQVLRLHHADADAVAGRRPGGLLSDPRRLPAALGGAALPLAAAAGTDTLVAALPAVVLVVLAQRLCTSSSQRQPAHAAADAALGVMAAVGPGLAAAAPVVAHGFATQTAVVVLLLVCAYDAGDYLIGSGSPTSWEGPAAGIVAVAVVSFAVSVVPLGPVDAAAALAIGGLTCLLAPLGPPAASLLIGDGRRPARHIRRLDSLLVLGPILPYALTLIL